MFISDWQFINWSLLLLLVNFV